MWGIRIGPGLQSLASPILKSPSCRRNSKNPTTLSIRASITDSGFPLGSRIVVRNLEYSITETSLKREFSSFGEIAKVKLFKGEGNPKSSRLSASIQYASQDEAILALENMDQTFFGGRLIYVELARPVRASSGVYLRTCGPPVTKQVQVMQEDDVADCWY
nr:chloroplast RRM domain-containing protein [Passiflora auriculata]